MIEREIPPNTLGHEPKVDRSVFVAQGVHLIGMVTLEKNSSIWYNSVLRGDINNIHIHEESNIQDGSIIHVANQFPCVVEPRVTVGHHVNLHACTVQEGCMIGIGAIVLSGAVVGRETIVAAGAVVRERQVLEPQSLYAGVPAKKIRSLSPEMIKENYEASAKYVELAQIYRDKGIL